MLVTTAATPSRTGGTRWYRLERSWKQTMLRKEENWMKANCSLSSEPKLGRWTILWQKRGSWWGRTPSNSVHFWLDCSTMPQVIMAVQLGGQGLLLHLLFKLKWNYCHMLHKDRVKLLEIEQWIVHSIRIFVSFLNIWLSSSIKWTVLNKR